MPTSQHSSPYDDHSGSEHNEPDYQRRHRYSRRELEELNASYAKNPRPTREEKERLACFCNVNVNQIQIWFQNRRAKDRRCAETRPHQHEWPTSSLTPSSTTPSPSSTSQTSRRQPSIILSHEPTPPSPHDRDDSNEDE